MRILVLVSGASGIVYALELLKALKGSVEIHGIISPNARDISKLEGVSIEEIEALIDVLHPYSLSAPPCSGSYRIDATISIPTSVKTLCSTARGIVSDPISRSLFVSLKERRRTVIVFRETPLTLSMTRCIEDLLLEGAIVTPAAPSFYHQPKSLEALVRGFVQRLLDRLGVEKELGKYRFGESSE